ncbi:GGDEF domain-containing protein [Alkalibacillus almallahensis]|uniref:GGDEF domain-containing protein n=1 Tax=Alkalibacillus almallahensis TaxID=1379154 RepID=UPI001421D4CF|nr:GGDEF domain-containing protein [Alkalibacillus almallahensis]NIK11006.1 diguanylate cyclase (GGDEF)-like protein [Alkalibacillus almallahensis]
MFNKKDEYIENIFSYARWLLLVSLALIFMLQQGEEIFIIDQQIFWYSIGIVALYTLIVHISLKALATYSKVKLIIVHIGLILDLIFYTIILLMAGSHYSLFLPLFFIWLLHITLVWSMKVSMLMTVLVMATYSIISYYVNGVNDFITIPFVMNLVIILLIGILTSSMTIRKEASSFDHIDYKEEAMKDYVSGLYNHRTFQNTLMKLVDQRKPIALIKFNIDDFQTLNDRLGYEWGDRVLAVIGSTLDFWVEPQKGYSFRYNGDEFTVILFDQKRTHLEQEIERWNNYIYEHVQLLEPLQGENVTLSYGVGTLMEKDDHNEFLRRVDRCMQQAKATGKNRAVFDETFQ